MQEPGCLHCASFFRPRERLFLGALVVVVFLAYQPAWHGGFIWDDDAHVTRPELRSWDGLCRIWFEPGATQQYYPLLHTAFWLEHKLWGDATLGYHLVNILLHAAAALMVASILRRLAIPGACLAAAIFALHPVHVESVAWITELKNTLSAVFYLAAAAVYLRFDRTRKTWPYAAALALFVLGLLSKTVTATLPAALLLIFWFERGRLSWRRDVLPLLPFFVLGAAAGVTTAWVERKLIGAEGAAFDLTLVDRCLLAGRAIWFYLAKLFWPMDLIFVYPRWQINQAAWQQYLFPAAALLLLLVLWRLRRWHRGPLAAMLFFIGTLFPVLGFCNVYPFIYSFVADHFQYLASLGIITLVSAGAALLLDRCRPWHRVAGHALCLALLATLASLTWRQCQMYSDVETLYRTTIDANPACWMAYNNLGGILDSRGETEVAIVSFQKALEIKSDYAEACANLGMALERQGQFDAASVQYRKALAIDPNHANAHINYGALLERQGQLDEAIVHYKKALAIRPADANAYVNLGVALRRQGKLDAAIAQYQKALAIKPDHADAHANLGAALGWQEKFDEAADQFRQALEIDSQHPRARQNLDMILSGEKQVLQVLHGQRESIAVRPNDTGLLNNTAWTLATSPYRSARNGAEAVEFARRALELSGGQEPAVLGTLAAAYAEAGQFPESVEAARRALAIATKQKKQALVESIKAKLPLYQAGIPYRQAPSLPAARSTRP